MNYPLRQFLLCGSTTLIWMLESKCITTSVILIEFSWAILLYSFNICLMFSYLSPHYRYFLLYCPNCPSCHVIDIIIFLWATLKIYSILFLFFPWVAMSLPIPQQLPQNALENARKNIHFPISHFLFYFVLLLILFQFLYAVINLSRH